MADHRQLEAALADAVFASAAAKDRLAAAPDDPDAREEALRAEAELEQAKAAVRRALRGTPS